MKASRIGPAKLVLYSLLPAILIFVAMEGIANCIWYYLEQQAYQSADIRGKENRGGSNVLTNFMKTPDPVRGYRLLNNYERPETFTMVGSGYGSTALRTKIKLNTAGFFQREEIPIVRRANTLRLLAIGESTTQGDHIDTAYPARLKQILEKELPEYSDKVEMINSGVRGYVSDQWALYTEAALAEYKPDIVVLYAGWNDFQSYSPLGPPPQKSYFEQVYDTSKMLTPVHGLKSIIIAANLLSKLETVAGDFWSRHVVSQNTGEKEITTLSEENGRASLTYRFFVRSLSRTVAALRSGNPDVKIVISTLVGRWPYPDDHAFEAGENSIWWMKNRGMTSRQAAEYLEQFNGVIRKFADDNHLALVDADREFRSRDKMAIMYDFCHMNEEGYFLLARTIADMIIAQRLVTN